MDRVGCKLTLQRLDAPSVIFRKTRGMGHVDVLRVLNMVENDNRFYGQDHMCGDMKVNSNLVYEDIASSRAFATTG